MNFNYGAFVISLDFELHWGLRDIYGPEGSYRDNILNARAAIQQTLDLFEEYEIAATWATVGFLFAKTRDELEKYSPKIRPRYVNDKLDPFQEPLGMNEREDPLHFAESVIKDIRSRRKQEIATHTFSHYYCLEEGQNFAAFQDDLKSAVAIAKARGVVLRSIVFPRNQVNLNYSEALLSSGIVCYRGNESNGMYQPPDRKYKQAFRLIDTYLNVSGPNITAWNDVLQANGLCNVPSSRFLRPYSPYRRLLEAFRVKRIVNAMHEAATSNKIFHLWWHPHNFGANVQENINILREVLNAFRNYQLEFGMRSLSMIEVADLVRGSSNKNKVAK